MVGGEDREAVRIFKALKHSVRMKIVELLAEKEELGFTDLLRQTGIKDKGKLSFHLRELHDLIRQDPITRKYRLSRIGRGAYEVVKGIEEKRAALDRDSRIIEIRRLGQFAFYSLLIGSLVHVGNLVAYAGSFLHAYMEWLLVYQRVEMPVTYVTHVYWFGFVWLFGFLALVFSCAFLTRSKILKPLAVGAGDEVKGYSRFLGWLALLAGVGIALGSGLNVTHLLAAILAEVGAWCLFRITRKT